MCAREKSFTDLKDMETQSHPRIEEAWDPNTLASHNPKPRQSSSLPRSLPLLSCWVVSLGKELFSFLVKHWSSDMSSLCGKAIGKARKVATTPLGCHKVPLLLLSPLGLQYSWPLQNCTSTKELQLKPTHFRAPLPLP